MPGGGGGEEKTWSIFEVNCIEKKLGCFSGRDVGRCSVRGGGGGGGAHAMAAAQWPSTAAPVGSCALLLLPLFQVLPLI